MHFSDLGMIAQALALVFALYAIASAVLGARLARPALIASSRRAVFAVAIFLVTAALSLVLSFATHDFGAMYVYEHSSLAMPWYYTTAAFYGGQEGSLLYWTMMLALFSSLVVALNRRAPAVLMPYVIATLMTIDTFLLIVVNFVTTPFARSRIVPTDGLGLNPLLQDPGMLIHPPMLLMGYMSFSVPFSFAVAALITGKLDAGWLRAIRRWMLASWTIQTCGLLLGAWWAYHVLGWGGYWGWDPVENAALLPWLTATAFLHSTMVQERRGTLKVWNLALVIATFALSIFGTFEVRSGIINSVHSFAYSSIGAFFFGFLALVLVAAIALCVYRLPRLRPEQQLDSVVSREGSFLLNNLLLSGIAFATFWGTIFPLLSATFAKQTMTVGPPFYESVNGPLFLVLIVLMGIGPLLAWRRASLANIARNFRWPALVAALVALALPILGVRAFWADVGFAACAFVAATIGYELLRGVRVRHGHGESYGEALVMLLSRHRTRYGGYLVHFGLIALAVGVIGSHMFQIERDADLHVGQSVSAGAYTLTYRGITDHVQNGIEVIQTTFAVSSGGRNLGDAVAGQQIFPNFPSQPTSIVSITTHGFTDLYVFLGAYDGTSSASIRVFVNPLVPLVWMGGILMILGGIACWWPERRRAAALSPSRARPSKRPATPVEVGV
ncbi:MAG TPA: heme lyase CcmF/NrfE family subunit [Ktedonobacterales bacterium]